MNLMREEILNAALEPPRIQGYHAEQDFCFAEDFVGFAGHFPDYPILPAILQALVGQLLAEQLHARPLRFLALERAKFTRQLRPGELIKVRLDSCERHEGLRCSVCLQVRDESAASFTLIFDKGTP